VKSVLLEFMTTDEKTIIFLIRQDWEEKEIKDSEPLVFEADFNEQDTLQCVKEIRGLYDEWRENHYNPEYLNKIDLEKRTSFYKIGKKIFSNELMSAIEGYELIYFVPFSALHHLPIHAMRDNYGVDIIDKFACSYLPSASVLQFVNSNKERPKEFNFKGIGVDFKNSEYSYDFVSEIIDLSYEEYFSKRVDYLGEEATKENFFKENEPYNIFHCSSHGYASKDNPMNSSIILYMPPKLLNELEKSKNIDEYYEKIENNQEIAKTTVTVNDLIKEFKTDFELVFLSACVSGENKNETGDELIGLSRGLFYSGTKSMILTLFNSFTNVTNSQDTHIKYFYKDWIEKKQPKSKAFQSYISRIKNNKKFKHPFYWFVYVLIGNPY